MDASEKRRSRHILIYGPPAAGKFTVAQHLAARHDARLLDNHVSIDAALRLFDFGTVDMRDLVERLRVELIGAAARAGLDIVSTLVFAHPIDRGHVSRLVQASTDGGAEVTFVQLLPPRSVLEERVAEPSRVATKKIHDLAQLRRMMQRFDLTTPINSDDLSIDNSVLPPADTAELIAHTIGLQTR
jgi:predicted kinase